MTSNIKLAKGEIKDPYVRDNFEKVETHLNKDVVGRFKFRFISHTFPNSTASAKIQHKLTYTPMDIILLSVTNTDGVTITWHYDDFDATNVVVTVSGACTIRFLVGRYEE